MYRLLLSACPYDGVVHLLLLWVKVGVTRARWGPLLPLFETLLFTSTPPSQDEVIAETSGPIQGQSFFTGTNLFGLLALVNRFDDSNERSNPLDSQGRVSCHGPFLTEPLQSQ